MNLIKMCKNRCRFIAKQHRFAYEFESISDENAIRIKRVNNFNKASSNRMKDEDELFSLI